MNTDKLKKVKGTGKNVAVVALALVLSLTALTGCTKGKNKGNDTNTKEPTTQTQQQDTSKKNTSTKDASTKDTDTKSTATQAPSDKGATGKDTKGN